jgi:hypothetical protein
MPRQVRAIVQQVLGEARGKRDIEVLDVNTTILNPNAETAYNLAGSMDRMGNPGGMVNLNLQQPYYQVHAYRPNGQPVNDVYNPRPNDILTAAGGACASMFKNVRDHVARTLREFGLEPKGRARTYQKLYPEFFDVVAYPRGFRVPDFIKFTGEDSKTTYEHIRQFLAQVSDFGINDMHKIRLFPLSLSSTAFN